ncbi:MAG: class I SAM-dependent DNA methyltransferase, partial [Planctomycetota bacterium]|nr:class I SAM-dependent DNA methyltransferase [Planctomycetota bacterium]
MTSALPGFAPVTGELAVREMEAAMKMARLYDAMVSQGCQDGELKVFLIGIFFCCFAQDNGIFTRGKFLSFLEKSPSDAADFAKRLTRLFQALGLSTGQHHPQRDFPWLRDFPRLTGDCFSPGVIPTYFSTSVRQLLLDCCHFDWRGISPGIFGSLFQGVMDRLRRRELGAHYTSEENILKVINPLFMDSLWREFAVARSTPRKLDAFHQWIAELQFLDPACGCGNFLMVAYRELRRLELEILKLKLGSGQRVLRIAHLRKVGVGQFHGIEIVDFPCQVAKVGMWLVDHQMNLLVSQAFGRDFSRLPLKEST